MKLQRAQFGQEFTASDFLIPRVLVKVRSEAGTRTSLESFQQRSTFLGVQTATRIFHIISHATPASTVPQIQLFLAPGSGLRAGCCPDCRIRRRTRCARLLPCAGSNKDYGACRFEVRLGSSAAFHTKRTCQACSWPILLRQTSALHALRVVP